MSVDENRITCFNHINVQRFVFRQEQFLNRPGRERECQFCGEIVSVNILELK